MNSSGILLVVNNIKLPINASSKEAFSVARRRLAKVGICNSIKSLSIYRRSIDARHKDNIAFVYSVSAACDDAGVDIDLLRKNNISVIPSLSTPAIEYGNDALAAPPIIVGSGPAGLFAALMLAEHGYKPVILERGGSVAERHCAVDAFKKFHTLDTDTNIQFGAGGAGTFSDGKLITRINDPLTAYVLERFVEFGASDEIKFIAKPHIGTDVLSLVVDRMISRICELGGRIEYHTKFVSPVARYGRLTAVETSRGKMPAGALLLAVGHSARDTYESLLQSDFIIEAKAFSVGMRIEHLTEDIDRAMYGSFAGDARLGHAEYSLSCDTKNRGTYTFCMCPGGEVVAAASETLGVVVNGMSYNSRSGRNSNSAVVTSVFKEDYGGNPSSAIEFQRKIERDAYLAAGGDYKAPIITVGDFLNGECRRAPERIIPTYMDGTNTALVSPERYLPTFVTNAIKQALISFDNKIKGFAASDAVLTGVETRTSAPIRLLRHPVTRLALGYENIYPAGEGAGYAGGITSAAVDGIKSAMALMKKYRP